MYLSNLFLHQGTYLVQSLHGAVALANCYWQQKDSVSRKTAFRLISFQFRNIAQEIRVKQHNIFGRLLILSKRAEDCFCFMQSKTDSLFL